MRKQIFNISERNLIDSLPEFGDYDSELSILKVEWDEKKRSFKFVMAGDCLPVVEDGYETSESVSLFDPSRPTFKYYEELIDSLQKEINDLRNRT